MKYQLHPAYPHCQRLINNIEAYFQDATEILHAERNEIRLLKFENQDYVIKSFRIPHIINRFAYRYLRDSKAKRSYQYSLKLGNKICPQPIAYIEQFRKHLLEKSYFISHYFNYDFTIRPVLNNKAFKNRNEILQQFAIFTYHLHQRRILHRDYSAGNILIKQQDANYIFKIIDVNRMQFKSLTLQDRLNNFAWLMVGDGTLEIILTHYAKLINKPLKEILAKTINYREQIKQRRATKNKLRGK